MIRLGFMPKVHYNSAKLFCKNGHPFNKENTYIRPNGFRTCRVCNLNSYHKK